MKLFIKPSYNFKSREMKMWKFHSRQLTRNQMRVILSKKLKLYIFLKSLWLTYNLPSLWGRKEPSGALWGGTLLEHHMRNVIFISFETIEYNNNKKKAGLLQNSLWYFRNIIEVFSVFCLRMFWECSENLLS